MKKINKTLTDEQIDIIIEFVYKWLNDGKSYKIGSDYTWFTIKDKDSDISYSVFLNMFQPYNVSNIIVTNNKLQVKITIHVGSISNDKLKHIENFIKKLQFEEGVGKELTNSDFFNLTNLTVDQSLLRKRKIDNIKNNME